MKDEIKEILNRLDYNEWEVDLYKVPITWSELYNIRDYITNLQEQLHQASLDIQELTEKDIGCPSWCDKLTNLQEENERLLKTQEMYEKKCNKIHQYITQNCEIIRHKDYDEIGKVNGGHILFLLNGGDEE